MAWIRQIQAHRNLAEELRRAGRSAEAAGHFEAPARLEAGDGEGGARPPPAPKGSPPAGN
jgi:hypothetical protein